MITHDKIRLSDHAVISAGLPSELIGLDRASLADLGAALSPCPASLDGAGYWPRSYVTPEVDATFERLTAEVEIEVDVEGKRTVATYIVEDLSPVAARANLNAALRAKRIAIRDGGMIVGGMPIDTDETSRGLIAGAYQSARDDVIEVFDFAAASGWVALSQAQMIGIGQALALHIQAAFSRHKALQAEIDATAEIESDAEQLAALRLIDIETGWPGQ